MLLLYKKLDTNLEYLNFFQNIITEGFFLSIILIIIGFFGLLINQKSFLILMMSIEIMFLGLILNFIFISKIFNEPLGIINSLFIITLAAAESALGLSLIIILYYFYKNINPNIIQKLRFN